MKVKFNDDLALWCVAVLQPASARSALKLVKQLLPEETESVTESVIKSSLKALEDSGHVICVHAHSVRYSTTAKANKRLSKPLRVARDSARLFLLPSRMRDSLSMSEGSAVWDLDGVSLPNDERPETKGAARPISLAAEPLRPRLAGQAYRPHGIQQPLQEVGPTADSSDFSLRYCSFANLKQIRLASGESGDQQDLSIDEFGLCVGVTPALVRAMLARKHRYYRVFSIPKRSGGDRQICAPRIFLKTVQRWINTFLLSQLPVHDACHAYVRGRSIVSNSRKHLGKTFVSGMDITDYFGSISEKSVFDLMLGAGFGPTLALTIAGLCTFRGSLPQGAPTSPTISNAYLFRFDQTMSQWAEENGLSYTRYADDLTVSGNDRAVVDEFLRRVTRYLGRLALRLNSDKTRTISKQGRQQVTGVVVNSHGYPPREVRRRVRAAIHRASVQGHIGRLQANRIRGALSYLKQFPGLRDSQELGRLREQFGRVRIDTEQD